MGLRGDCACADSDGVKGKLSPVVLRAAPYGGGALVVCVLGSSAGLGLELGSYGAAFALLVAVGLLLPLWGAGAPGGLRIVPVLVFLLAVALLRHAGGGAGTGVAALILLPVLWVALHGSRRELAVVVVGVAAFFVVPFVLVGPPIYPVSPWRTALFASAVAGIAGLLVQRLVGQVREQVRRALQRQRDVEVLLHLMHEIAGAVDVRRAVCEAALVVSGAPACVLLECGGQQRLVATAAAGASGESLVLEPPEGPVARALATGRGELVSAAGGGQVDHALLAALGEPAWVAVEPVVGRGVTGVLVVSWGQAVERSREALALLAAEAASAIARADLLAELESLARIDPLTGLPNRRAWDEALASAVARV